MPGDRDRQIDPRISVSLRIGEISEIGRVSIRRNAHDGLADLEAGQGHFGVEADAAIGVRYVDLRILARDRILHHHRQELRVEGIAASWNLVENRPWLRTMA